MTRIVTVQEYRRETLRLWAAVALTVALVTLGAAADLGGWFA